MDKIKVLYIDEISRIAGGENWFLNFADGLNREIVEPILICPEGPFAEAARSKGVKVIPFTFRFCDLSSNNIGITILFGFFRILKNFFNR